MKTETKPKRQELVVTERFELLGVEESALGIKKASIKIISEGLTKDKQRFYSKAALKAGAGKFIGAKMYLNHMSASEKFERPERSVEDYIATIDDAEFIPADKEAVAYIKGRAVIHGSPAHESEKIHSWLKNLSKAKVGADLSIHAFLLGEQGEYEGRPTMIISDFDEVLSVDFVTTGNAGGKVESVESLKKSEKEGGDEMKFEELTAETLKEKRPDIVAAIQESAKGAEEMKDKDTRIQELESEKAKLEKELSEKKLAEKKESLIKSVESVIKEAKLPESTEARVREKVAKIAIDEKTESIADEVGKIIKEEKDYLESLSKAKVFANGDPDPKPEGGEEGDKEESVESLLKGIAESKKK